jgi:hypothetical protein
LAVDWVDGCAHYGQNQEALKWTFVATPFILPTGNPRGGPCLQFRSPCMITRKHEQSFIWGWRYQTTVSQQNTGGTIYSFNHAGTTLGGLRVEADNTLTIFGGNGNVIGAAGGGSNTQNTGNPTLLMPGQVPFVMQAFTWYWFEMMVSLSGSGSADVQVTITFRVNTQQLLTGTVDSGIPTDNLLLQSPTANLHIFQGSAGDFSSNGCDFVYIRNDSTGLINTYPGDTQVGPYVLPNSDQTIQWNATGTPQYAQINEVPPTEDITYIDQQPSGITDEDPLGTPNQIDSFLFQPLPATTGTILAVQILAFNRKDNEGTREFTFTVSDIVPTGNDEPPTFYPSDSYIYSSMCWDNDPDTQAAWTIPGFNAKKFGVKIVG